jgi:PAS domain-containing protein
MDQLWMWVGAGAAVIAALELFLLNRQRRLFLLDPLRRRFFVRHAHLGTHYGLPFSALSTPPDVPSSNSQPGLPDGGPHPHSPETGAALPPEALEDSQPSAPHPPDVALLYVDPEGRCTAANEAAHRLLHWREEEGTLNDVLSGSREDIELLLDRVTREAVVPRYFAVLRRPPALPVEISAIALRDRDSNFWGTALFVRIRDSNVTLADSAVAPSPQ